MNREWKTFGWFAVIFVVAYYLPLSNPKVTAGIQEAFRMVQWYARNHTLACVVPALFIAGATMTFLSQETVLRHLGPQANKTEAYAVASTSGILLAVCSCSVLPIFAGIYRMGAGLGPASAFLYAGPALNILAVFLTARVLGFRMGVARTIGAIVFAVVIGLLMEQFFRRHDDARNDGEVRIFSSSPPQRSRMKTVTFFVTMVAFLVFSDWYHPGDVVVTTSHGQTIRGVQLQETRETILIQLAETVDGHSVGEKMTLAKADITNLEEADTWVLTVYHIRWWLAGVMGFLTILMAWKWFDPAEIGDWMHNTWDFAKLLLPLLYGGIFFVGFISGLLPDDQIVAWVGGNTFLSNFVASLIGCLFYFATLTEIPILQALIQHGMAQGPALALLLAGPALSLPSLFVIRSIIGFKKTAVFSLLVVLMATITGMAYGRLW